MIYSTQDTAAIFTAISNVLESNTGYSDIGTSINVANAIESAGFIVIQTKDLFGNKVFRAFTKEAQAALKQSSHAVSTYKSLTSVADTVDYEKLILTKQENSGYFD